MWHIYDLTSVWICQSLGSLSDISIERVFLSTNKICEENTMLPLTWLRLTWNVNSALWEIEFFTFSSGSAWALEILSLDKRQMCALREEKCLQRSVWLNKNILYVICCGTDMLVTVIDIVASGTIGGGKLGNFLHSKLINFEMTIAKLCRPQKISFHIPTMALRKNQTFNCVSQNICSLSVCLALPLYKRHCCCSWHIKKIINVGHYLASIASRNESIFEYFKSKKNHKKWTHADMCHEILLLYMLGKYRKLNSCILITFPFNECQSNVKSISNHRFFFLSISGRIGRCQRHAKTGAVGHSD